MRSVAANCGSSQRILVSGAEGGELVVSGVGGFQLAIEKKRLSMWLLRWKSLKMDYPTIHMEYVLEWNGVTFRWACLSSPKFLIGRSKDG